LQAAIGAAAVVACLYVWRRSDDLGTRAAALVASILLATPYVLAHDTAIQVVPFACLAARAGARGLSAPLVLLLALLWAGPVGQYHVANASGLPVGPLVNAALLAYAVSLARRDDAALAARLARRGDGAPPPGISGVVE
jgi:hypothetical protein